jgi:hypothetical protein
VHSLVCNNQCIFNQFKIVCWNSVLSINEQRQYNAVARCLCDFPRDCRCHDLNMMSELKRYCSMALHSITVRSFFMTRIMIHRYCIYELFKANQKDEAYVECIKGWVRIYWRFQKSFPRCPRILHLIAVSNSPIKLFQTLYTGPTLYRVNTTSKPTNAQQYFGVVEVQDTFL